MTIAVRLRTKMLEKELSENELGRRSGVPQPTVHRILNGDSMTPRKDTVEKLARALGVSPEWLLFGPGHGNVSPTPAPHREARKYPLISWVEAGSWAEARDAHQIGLRTDMLSSNVNAGSDGYWLEVHGDSMTPAHGNGFPPGMRILVQPEGFDVINEKFYIAKIWPSEETTFKQYVRDAGIEYLKPLNPDFKMIEIDENVEIIGRVVDARYPSSFL